jgi:RNA polymerase sigma-54 factor
MKASLQFKLSQNLALTPQLQQSIRLLQLSTLELNQELEQILSENPLLERLDDPLSSCIPIAANGSLDLYRAGPAADLPGPPGDEAGTMAGKDGESSDPFAGDPVESGDRFDGSAADLDPVRRNRDDGDESDWPQLAGASPRLRDHLMAQLGETRASRRDRALVELLIDELNDDGLLETPLADIAASLPAELEIEPEELSAALRLLQSFEPVGTGARNLRECLLLQLDAADRDRAQDRIRTLARAIVSDHLEALAARDWAQVRRCLACDDESLRQAQRMIRQLNPRPGAGMTGEAPSYIVPDVIVRKGRSDWVVELNAGAMPRLRVNEQYAGILKRNRGAHPAMSGQLQEARWLVKNVQQRFDTILRVSTAIVERQRAFFSHGEIAMRPLVLREIADTLGLHESTVSRVTTHKYMLTPSGTFELKHFFGSHVSTESGGAASSTAIRAVIRQLVEAEDTRQPLSDNRIAELLGDQGFMVARRTVAKYREALRIPAVANRRAL